MYLRYWKYNFKATQLKFWPDGGKYKPIKHKKLQILARETWHADIITRMGKYLHYKWEVGPLA